MLYRYTKRLAKTTKKAASRVFIAAIVGVVVAGSVVPRVQNNVAHADTLSDLRSQAAALQQQIADNAARAAELAKEADSLKNKIAEFDLQIAQISAQIDLTNVKLQQLQNDLDNAQAELDRQKELLRTSLRSLYKNGNVSSFELLVGSQSFSDYINDQTYLERLKSGIQKSTEKVIALKQQITDNKKEQEDLLKQQQQQKSQLDAARAEKQSTLDQTQGQEASYQAMVSSLKQQQLEINRKIFAQSQAQMFAGDPNHGGYPTVWGGTDMDTLVDSWGMFNRECVSYAAYKVAASGRHMPSNWPSYYASYGPGHGGNANDWLGDAEVDGIPYDRSPRAGDVGILHYGTYGHAVYVEQVLDGGRVYISQYNYDWNGNYSEAIINYTTANWYFIHFP